jgi:BTB/POZ domain-containing protein KCTD9
LTISIRNGRYFEPILNYFRTGEIIYESNLNPKGILEEAKFYGVQELIDKFQQIVDESTVISNDNTPLTRKDVVKALIQTSNKSELRFQVFINFFN